MCDFFRARVVMKCQFTVEYTRFCICAQDLMRSVPERLEAPSYKMRKAVAWPQGAAAASVQLGAAKLPVMTSAA